MPDDSGTWEPLVSGPALQILHEGGHRSPIKGSVSQVRVLPVQHFELPARLRSLHVDSYSPQTREMIAAQDGIDDVNRLFAALQAFLHEGKKYPVLLVPRVEERADVTLPAEHPAGQGYGWFLAVHVIA